MNASVSDSDNGAMLQRAQTREAKLNDFDQELKLSSSALEKDYEESQKHKCEAAEVLQINYPSLMQVQICAYGSVPYQH